MRNRLWGYPTFFALYTIMKCKKSLCLTEREWVSRSRGWITSLSTREIFKLCVTWATLSPTFVQATTVPFKLSPLLSNNNREWLLVKLRTSIEASPVGAEPVNFILKIQHLLRHLPRMITNIGIVIQDPTGSQWWSDFHNSSLTFSSCLTVALKVWLGQMPQSPFVSYSTRKTILGHASCCFSLAIPTLQLDLVSYRRN